MSQDEGDQAKGQNKCERCTHDEELAANRRSADGCEVLTSQLSPRNEKSVPVYIPKPSGKYVDIFQATVLC